MTLVLDAGALVSIEGGRGYVAALVKAERLAGRVCVTHGGIIAQVWRGGSGRQAEVARLLTSVTVSALDDNLGRRAGVLLGRAGAVDAIDAAVICLARHGDTILTSDPSDLRGLAAAAGIDVNLVAV